MPAYVIDLIAPISFEHLNTEMRAQFGDAISGISANGNDWVSIEFPDGNPSAQQQADADAVLAAHDPAFLTADKSTIDNSGSDVATITIAVPRNVNNATTVTATVEGVETDPLPLTNNEATLQVDGLDLIDGDTIEVGVVGFVHDEISIQVTSA